jgi:hypothetical protein
MESGKRSVRWVSEPHAEVPPAIAESGFASIPPITAIEAVLRRVEVNGNDPALYQKRPIDVRYPSVYRHNS